MRPVTRAELRRFYELCKRSGCSDWRTRSCFNNCPCNAVCEALFTEIRKHLGNFLNRCSGKPLRCGFAAARVHGLLVQMDSTWTALLAAAAIVDSFLSGLRSKGG